MRTKISSTQHRHRFQLWSCTPTLKFLVSYVFSEVLYVHRHTKHKTVAPNLFGISNQFCER